VYRLSIFTRLPCPCHSTAIGLAYGCPPQIGVARLRIHWEAEVRVVEEADAVLHDAEVLGVLVVDALGVPLGDPAVGEDTRVAEEHQHILPVEPLLTASAGVVGLPGDVVDGLGVDDSVLLRVATALLGSAAREDVHAIVG
jgi:hypothetical protein